jgi:drug/metabolite transporter (DMT)-like permease
VISYLAALATVVANAASNVLNRKASLAEPAQDEFRFRLIIDLLGNRTWWLAIAMMLVSFPLGSLALGTGELATVQIILTLELPMTLIGASRFLGARVRAREGAAIAATLAGVIGLLACLDPRPGPARMVPAWYWVLGSAANGGAALALFLAAKATRDPARQAALLGAACGLGYALTSAYTKGMTQEFAVGGLAGVLTSWQLYAAGAAGAASTWLLQNAYHAGRLSASQPGITLLDPIAATIWGVLAFGEQVNGGLLAGLAVLPFLLLAGGALALSRSLVAAAGTAGPPSAPRP